MYSNAEIDTDIDRRAKLRSYLMYLRSRIAPGSVGLPATKHRRVPGLRREEVAELIGVSGDWYRWFESGRPVSVSPQLLARLSAALKLDPCDEVTLFHLSLPELYRAGGAAAVGRLSSMSPNVLAVTLPSEIEEAQRVFDSSREVFLTLGAGDVTGVRPRILSSWKRSQSLHVDASKVQAPLACTTDDGLEGTREESHALLTAASPIMSHLVDMLSEMGYAVTLTDGAGRILQVAGDAGVRRHLERLDFVPGGDWSEGAAGTNAIGTALADGRPLQLMGAEHFCDGWQNLTCTAAPIRNPRTLEVAGVLDITGHYTLVRAHLLALIMRSALEIEEELAEASPAYDPRLTL